MKKVTLIETGMYSGRDGRDENECYEKEFSSVEIAIKHATDKTKSYEIQSEDQTIYLHNNVWQICTENGFLI
jgi:hypothetical protein